MECKAMNVQRPKGSEFRAEAIEKLVSVAASDLASFVLYPVLIAAC